MGVLIDRIRDRREMEGRNTAKDSYKWLLSKLKNPDNNLVKEVSPEKIVPGNLYFMFYDLGGALKSSRLEQYSPILALRKGIVQSKPILWGFSLNFLPERIKVNWFDQLMNRFFKGALNTDLTVTDTVAPLKVTFEGVYKTLASIGFEYAIREFRMDLITKVYQINLTELDRFTSFDTMQFTGVDPKKLVEIWIAKLGEGPERMQEIRDNILTDYKKVDDELFNSFDEVERSKDFLSRL